MMSKKPNGSSSIKTKIGYKIVATPGLYSLTSSPYGIVYKVGEWAEPKRNCGPLCVFDDFRYSCLYAIAQINQIKLFKCAYDPSIQGIKVWTPDVSAEIDKLIIGTKLADKVKLLEEIPAEEYLKVVTICGY